MLCERCFGVRGTRRKLCVSVNVTEIINKVFQKRVVCPFLFWYNEFVSESVVPCDGDVKREREGMSHSS